MRESGNDGVPVRLRADGVEFVDVEGEVAVLDAVQLLYYSVNDSGVYLWPALRDGTTEDGLRRMLVDEHGLSEEKAAADVNAFLQQLDKVGLLDRSD